MPINLGILGLAHAHVAVYCDEWAKHPELGVRVTAAWDHDAERVGRAATAHALGTFASPAELLSGAKVDAVVIGAETSAHADLVELAAASGKPIILQKPLALTREQADRIVAAVTRANVPFTVAWQMRVDPQNLQMKQWMDDGKFGRVFMIRRRHGLSTHIWPGFEKTWHVKPDLNRGMWADDAAHAIDFLLWLRGRPQSVVAEIETLHNPNVPDDNGMAIFRYADGTLAEIVCSFTCLAGENTTEIVGERGVAIQNFGDGPSVNYARPRGAAGLKWFDPKWQQWRVVEIPSPENHAHRIAALAPELARFLRGDRPPIATAEEGRTALAMTLACYESAATGRRVQID